jgi:hypothetical protein
MARSQPGVSLMTHSLTLTNQHAFLAQQRGTELARLFATLPAGQPPEGALRGKLMAVRGLDRLPRGLAGLLYRLLALPLNPWRGKRFASTQGSNLWFALGGLRFAHFSIEQRPGSDGNACHWLDYSLASNPGLLRPIRGEARQMQPGLWLCRMQWQREDGLVPVLWFTLQGDTDAH